MTFSETTLASKRPASVREVLLPRRGTFHPSPADWRDEVIYFLLPDRFSDGKDATRPTLDPAKRSDFRPATFSFEGWSESGGDRFQGGTIAGVTSKTALHQGSRGHNRLGRAGVQTAVACQFVPWLRHPGFLGRRPQIRHPQRSGESGRVRPQPRTSGDPRRRVQPHREQLDLRQRTGPAVRSGRGPISTRSGQLARRDWGPGRRDRRPTTTASGPPSCSRSSYYTRAGEGNLGARRHRRPARRVSPDRLHRRPGHQLRRYGCAGRPQPVATSTGSR